jgi:DNA-binding CsgD family transcriptional regulator
MPSALVGRSAETRSIAALLNSAAGESAALILEGEAGIGKTTLWLDALQRARKQGLRVLAARTSPAESVLAYAALADLLAEVDHDLWSDLPATQRHGLAAALLSDHESAAPAVDQRAVGAAFLAVLDRLATESPVLVAIDDLQWLDGSSAAAVAFAARRISSRAAWLCTARSDTASVSSGWVQLGRPDAVRRIRLAPLTIGELHDVLIAQLASPIPRPRLLRIHQISGGNPFYAVELAREIDQLGSGAELKLPDSLSDLTHSRISRIGKGADDALLAIASLADPTIRAVAQAIDITPQRLIAMLCEAETQKIVAIGGRRVRFTHPLLAHAVYLRATPHRRRTMHRRLAEVVTEPELCARHLALADPVGEPETLDALDSAADIARGRGAPGAAAELLELAINLGGATGHRRIRLAQCLFDSGDPRRAREALEAAIADLPPGSQRAEALQQLAMVRLYDDSFRDAAELCQLALTDTVDDSAQRVIVMTTLAFAQLNTGRPDVALQTAEQAVAAAERLDLPEPLSRALGMRAIMRFMNGDGVAANDLQRAAALENHDATVPVALRPSVQRALLLGWTGELVSARKTLAEIEQRCAAAGEEGEMMFLAFQSVLFDIWLGDLRRAADIAHKALERARQIGGEAALFLASSVEAAVAAYQGRVEDARRFLEGALAAGVGSGYILMMAWAVSIQAFLELSLGRHAQALAAIEPLLPTLQIAPRYTEIIGATFVPDAAEAMIKVGRLDEAEGLVQPLELNGARLDRAWMLAVGARCRAMLSAAHGDVAAGVAHGHRALAHHDRIEMPFERARTLLVLGRLERRLRHWRPATAALSEALTIFQAVGAPLWAAQVQAELDRGSSGRTGTSGLTPTERRVAELAAGGMNNRDIAGELFIAPKTIEVNLSRIYRKLGIHSRIELYHVMNNAVRLEAPASDDAARKPEA